MVSITEKSNYRVSLYYRMFLLFGITFSVILLCMGAFVQGLRENYWAKKLEAIPEILVPQLAESIPSPPTKEDLEKFYHQFEIDFSYSSESLSWTTGKISSLEHEKFVNGKIQKNILVVRRPTGVFVFYLGTRIQDISFGLLIFLGITISLIIYLSLKFFLRQYKPLDDLSRGAEHFSNEDYAYRLNLVRNDELGDLAKAFDLMATKIETNVEARNRLLMAMAHEVRSPLTRMKLRLEYINDEVLQKELAGDIDHLSSITSMLLEKERLSADPEVLDLVPISLAHFIKDNLKRFESRVEFQLKSFEEDIFVDVDVTMMGLFISNIVENAIKYSDKDIIIIQISLVKQDDQVELKFTDNGPGIRGDKIDYLSESFYQASEARTPGDGVGGVGLGLSFCHAIANAHGGSLRFESPVGEGLTVIMVLPVIPPESDELSDA